MISDSEKIFPGRRSSHCQSANVEFNLVSLEPYEFTFQQTSAGVGMKDPVGAQSITTFIAQTGS